METMDSPSKASVRIAARSTLPYGIIATVISLAEGFAQKLWEHAVLSWIDESIGTEVEKMEPVKLLIAHPFILAGTVVAGWAMWIIALAHIKDRKTQDAEAHERFEPPVSRGQSTAMPEDKKPIVHIEQGGSHNTQSVGNITINPDINPNRPVVTYDFNGATRTTTPGGSSVVIDDDVNLVAILDALQSQKQWDETLRLCKDAINRKPGWLTPYMAAGIAYANKGDKNSAIKMFQHVVKESGGNDEYSEARRLLNLLAR